VLAKEFGMSTCTVSQIVRGAIWKHITNGISVAKEWKGERQGSHKLTESQIKEIRDLHFRKVTSSCNLSKQFKVSDSHISRIVNRKEWTHVH
jgi:Mor family transcriptional regulator